MDKDPFHSEFGRGPGFLEPSCEDACTIQSCTICDLIRRLWLGGGYGMAGVGPCTTLGQDLCVLMHM